MPDFARSTHPAVQSQLDRLAKLSPVGDRLGLDRIAQILDRLGRPHDAIPTVFHVAGTNGKGSTCAFLRAALEASGKSVHMFTSPHLVRFNERIRVAGQLIEDDALAGLLAEVLAVSEDVQPSFFEVATATAILAFARTPADACIIEVGLGGRLDATNVIERPSVCGIASLGFDHQQFLGDRLPDIAGEKAGIAKRGVPLLTQLYSAPVAGRIGEIAAAVGARWLPRGGQWDVIAERKRLRYRDGAGEFDLPLPRLPGRFQTLNAGLAIAMLRHQTAIPVGLSCFGAAMGMTDWPARLQRLNPGPFAGEREIWIDGAHNASAAQPVASWAKRLFSGRPLHLIFGSLQSKDSRSVLESFKQVAAHVHTVPIDDHECRSPQDLVAVAAALGMQATAHATLDEAVAAVPAEALILIFGSLYLAGEALAANDQVPD
ncbi:MAG: folylpolyglutamate synthase/dihydrofolate synthase family protein [Sphingomicrobium sp.]